MNDGMKRSGAGDRIISMREACKRLGNIHISTAYRWNKIGRFPPIRKLSARRVGVLESDLSILIAGFDPSSPGVEACSAHDQNIDEIIS